MIFLIIGLIILFFIFLRLKSIYKINIKTFFRKGFKTLYNEFGLFCFCGKQGSGKTYSAIRYIIDNRVPNSYLLTNVLSFSKKYPSIYMSSIMDIIDFCKEHEKDGKQIYIFFDEIFTILEKKTNINKDILSFISQLRKRSIVFITTAQEWSEINITFRRYVRFEIACRIVSFPFTHTAIFFNSVHDGDTIHWNQDTQDFEADLIQVNIHKGNKYIVDSYDTFETIKT